MADWFAMTGAGVTREDDVEAAGFIVTGRHCDRDRLLLLGNTDNGQQRTIMLPVCHRASEFLRAAADQVDELLREGQPEID